MPVADEVARALDADLSLTVTRKLPYPDNPESGFGAVAEDGSVFIYERAARLLDPETIERIKTVQREEIARWISVLRGGRPLPEMADRTVPVSSLTVTRRAPVLSPAPIYFASR